MPTDLKLPLLGDVMVEGTLASWLKVDGAAVERGEPIYQLETDKVSYAVEAPASGVLRQIVAAGETVAVGTVVGTLLEARQTPVRDADPEAADDTDNRDPAVRASPAARRLARQLGVDISALGATRRIRSEDVAAFARDSSAGQATDARTASGSPAHGAETRTLVADGEEVRATPAARRLARQRGVTLSPVPGGRLVRLRDVSDSGAPQPLAATNEGVVTRVLGARRRVIAERMHASLQTMAQLTISMEVDVTDALGLRAQLAQLWGATDRPSITDLVSRAAILALVDHADLNATLDGQTVAVYEAVNLGLAVDAADGLLVPVVHGANRLNLRQLASATKDVATRARDNRLALADLQGGTFTVTTLGQLGVDFFTPIINPPQVAILGIGRTFEKLTRRDGQVVGRTAMHLNLSFDHRAIDGAPAARFLAAVKRFLELPVSLVTE